MHSLWEDLQQINKETSLLLRQLNLLFNISVGNFHFFRITLSEYAI